MAFDVVNLNGQDVTGHADEETILEFMKKDERYLFDIDKALVHLDGKAAYEYMLDALLESNAIDRISFVGPKSVGTHLQEQGYLKLNDVVFTEQGSNRVRNTLLGAQALEARGTIPVFSGDTPLMDPELNDEDLVKKVLEQHEELYGEKTGIIPLINQAEGTDRWRPYNSWMRVWKPDWQDDDTVLDKYGNALFKEANYMIIDFSNPKLDLNVLEDVAHMIKLRGVKEKLQTLWNVAKLTNKQADLGAVDYVVNTLSKLGIASQIQWESARLLDYQKTVAYIFNMRPDDVAFPRTRVMETHPDLDTLEDAYRLMREIQIRKTGKDIEKYEELEPLITYEHEGKQIPLIKRLRYDKIPVEDITRNKEDWQMIGYPKGYSGHRFQGFPMMDKLFYERMNLKLGQKS